MLFSLDWPDTINATRREIVFEHRHKEYGGYLLRKEYHRHVLTALLISILAIVLAVSAPLITAFLSKVNLENKIKISESINLEEPPPIDKNTPPPPPVIPPPPVQQTIKFTPPKVVKDEEVEEPPPTQEETKETVVSTVTQEGENIPELPPDPIVSKEEDVIFTVVEEMPSFPGGDQKLTELLSRIQYPIIARENNISGWVYLGFIVDKEGKVKEAKVLKGIGGGCDEEAMRVLMSLPDWKPGRQNGRAVPVRSSVRVNFTLK